MKFIKAILFLPFALIYGFIIFIRNKFFDWKILKEEIFNIPLISVGNLSTGGTGKTPQVEYLIRLLKEKQRLAVLSRGYGRKTRGYLEATPESSYLDIGDEPMQYMMNFPEIIVAVCEKRVKGIQKLLSKENPPELIILDDAFQHRYVKPTLNILLTDYYNLYCDDFILPIGKLREFYSGAKRADIVIVTKTDAAVFPSITRNLMIQKLQINSFQKIYFSYIKYTSPIPLFNYQKYFPKHTTTIFMIAGIANPYPFEEFLKEYCMELYPFIFPDHHHFIEKDITNIITEFNNHLSKSKVIVTTEKDAQRLKIEPFNSLLAKLPIYYVPIQIAFHTDKEYSFDDMINHKISRSESL